MSARRGRDILKSLRFHVFLIDGEREIDDLAKIYSSVLLKFSDEGDLFSLKFGNFVWCVA